jgi:hypothetical protein
MHLHGEAGVNRRGLEGERESERDAVDEREGGPGVARYRSVGGKREREREREKAPRAMGTGMVLSSLAGPFAAVQFETGHQRCLHTMATPP